MKRLFKISCYGGILLFGLATLFNYIIIHKSSPFLYDKIEDLPEVETALVLGSSLKGRNGGINSYFKNRMEAAAELYFSGKIKSIIVSGENSTKDYDEATDMEDYLIALGVPKSAIIKDYAGFRTLDSVIRAKKVFNCTKLIIVSQEFHNQRAVYAARHHGIDAIGLNATDVVGTSKYARIREFAAKFWMILDIHCFHKEPKFL